MPAGLSHQLDVGVERAPCLATRKKMSGEVQGYIMGSLHPGAQSTSEHRHIDEAHDCAAVDRPSHVHMVLGREHSADASTRTVGLEQKSAGCGSETGARKVSPAVPAVMFGIGSRAPGDADIVHPLQFVVVLVHAVRSAIIFLVSAIALAGLRPLGHTLAQFMIVWQR